MTSSNIKVAVKVRPLIQREKNENLTSQWSLVDGNTIKSNNREYKFSFDHIFDETRSTPELFETVAKPIVTNVVNGINGTIFAYGQTSSGKTYCMMGTKQAPGIIPLCINEIFKQIEDIKDREFLIRIGYIEIYNEKIYDLLVENKTEILKIHENGNGELAVNQTEVVSSSPDVILEHYDTGSKGRRVGETCMNERSSRSHTIFRIVIESHENGNDGVFQVSTLNLVDLAGSERVEQTKATGERLREGGHINKSLLSLSKVIRELSDLNDDKAKNVENAANKYINYRDSKLTRILSASLGGNALTAIICTITPAALEETYSTLTFAGNAKNIKNQPKVNETVSDKVIMNRLQKEIAALKAELKDEKSKNTEASKIQRLIAQIFDRESQIIHFHSDNNMKAFNMNRRRTWCPMSSGMEKIVEETSPTLEKFAAPPPFILRQQINGHSGTSEPTLFPAMEVWENEEFQTVDGAIFGDSKEEYEPLRPFNQNKVRTPKSLQPKNPDEMESPEILPPATVVEENKRLRKKLDYLQNELDELQDFKALEDLYQSNSEEEIMTLNQRLMAVSQELAKSKEEVTILTGEVAEKLIEIEDLKNKKILSEQMEIEYKKALKERDNANNILESANFEHEQAKSKFKAREEELIQSLQEARNETQEGEKVLKEKIQNLEQLLKKTEEDLFLLESKKKTDSETVVDSHKVASLESAIKDLENKLQEAEEARKSAETTANETVAAKMSDLESIIKELEKKLQAAEDDKKAAETAVNETFTDKVASLENIIKELESKLQETVKEKNSAEAMLKDKNREIETLSDQVVEAVQETDSLQGIIQKLEEAAKSKDEQFTEISTRTESLENEKQQLLNQIAEIRHDAEVLTEKLLANQTVSETEFHLREKIDALETELKTTKEQLEEQLLKNNGDYSIMVDQLDNQIKIEELTNENETLATSLKELKTVLEGKIKEAEKSNEQLEEYAIKISSYESEISQLTSKLEESKDHDAKLVDAAAEVSKIKAEFAEKVEELTKEKESLVAELNDLKTVVEEKSKEIEKLQVQVSDEVAKSEETFKAEFAAKVEELTKEKESLVAELNDLKTVVEEKSKEIEKLQVQVSDEVSKTKEALNVQINDLQMALDEKTKEVENMQVQLNEELSKEKDSIGAELIEFKAALEVKVRENEQLKAQQEGSAAQMSELQTAIDEKTKDIESLKEQLEEAASKINFHENEISSMTPKFEKLKEENAQLISENAEHAADIARLDAELTNSRSLLVIKEEKFKSLQSELLATNDQLKSKIKECDDIKTRFRRRSEDNERKVSELELANSKLMQDVGAVEVLRITAENNVQKLTEENKALKDASNDNDMKYAILDEKYSQLSAIKNELEKQVKEKIDVVKRLEDENRGLGEKLANHSAEYNTKIKEIQELREKCEKLVEEAKENQSFKPKKSSSPALRRSDEKELFLNNVRDDEVAHGTPARLIKSKIERKSRRQSVYDCRRDLSDWESPTSTESTQTDPVDRMCACADLQKKIKSLQADILIKDASVNNLKRMANVNIYKYDLEDAKKECLRLRSDVSRKEDEIENLRAKLTNLETKYEELEDKQMLLVSMETHQKLLDDRNDLQRLLNDAQEQLNKAQTKAVPLEDYSKIVNDKHELLKKLSDVNELLKQATSNSLNMISKEDFRKLEDEKNDLKKKLDEMKKELDQLKMMSEKENLNSNKLQSFSSSESGVASENVQNPDYDTLNSNYKLLLRKYDTAKRLCNLRNDDLNTLREELQVAEIRNKTLSVKYEKAKKILEIRMEKIQDLRGQLGLDENGQKKSEK